MNTKPGSGSKPAVSLFPVLVRMIWRGFESDEQGNCGKRSWGTKPPNPRSRNGKLLPVWCHK